MLTPVSDDRRFTAKSEPMPDMEDNKRYRMKCPDFIRAVITANAPTDRANIIGYRLWVIFRPPEKENFIDSNNNK
jgi:hypothetical protein